MSRVTCSLMLGLALLQAGVAAAQQDEEKLGKKRTEWLRILKEHKEVKFRRAAVLVLLQYGPRGPGVMPAWLDAMESDPEPEIRREVALLVGLLGSDAKGAVDGLAARLEKDKSDKVREAAARSLGKLAEFASIHVMALGRALKDPSPDARAAAAESLKSFGDKAKLVVPQLIEALQDPKTDHFTRLYAMQILSKQAGDDEKTAQVLAGILGNQETPIILRQAAAEGLGSMGPIAGSAATQLAGLTEDAKQELELRRAAAVALGKIGDKAAPALPAILRLLQESDIGLRYQAVRIAGQLGKGNAKVIDGLLKRLREEKNAEVLLAVVQELGELGAKEAEPDLTRLANNDPRQSIRAAAEASLKKLKGS